MWAQHGVHDDMTWARHDVHWKNQQGCNTIDLISITTTHCVSVCGVLSCKRQKVKIEFNGCQYENICMNVMLSVWIPF